MYQGIHAMARLAIFWVAYDLRAIPPMALPCYCQVRTRRLQRQRINEMLDLYMLKTLVVEIAACVCTELL